MQVRQHQNKKFKTGLFELSSCRTTVIPPHHQIRLPVHCTSDITQTTGAVEGTPVFMRETCLLVSSVIADLTDGKTMIQVTNPNEHTFTLDANRTIAFFRIPIPHQAANIIQMPSELLRLTSKFPEGAEAVINQLFANLEFKHTKWYPTPETCSEPEDLTKIKRRISDDILALREICET